MSAANGNGEWLELKGRACRRGGCLCVSSQEAKLREGAGRRASVEELVPIRISVLLGPALPGLLCFPKCRCCSLAAAKGKETE